MPDRTGKTPEPPADDAARSLVIHGERGSGTNFVERLVVGNFRHLTVRHDLGWKHGFYDPRVLTETGCLVLIVTRHPFSWIRSVHKRPWHAAPDLKAADFSAFIRKDWRSVWDRDALNNKHIIVGPQAIDAIEEGDELTLERDPISGGTFANVIQLRNAKHRNWLALKQKHQNCSIVRYEDVLSDPKRFIKELQTRFGLQRKLFFRPVRSYKGLGWRKYKPRPYAELTASDRNLIVSELDRDIEAALGYELEAPH